MNRPEALPQTPLTGCGPLRPETGPITAPLRQQVFEAVRSAGRISRSDVAKHLGVSPGSVTSQVGELIEMGLLHEVADPSREATRGRPPVALSVRPEAGYVVGMKLSDAVHSAIVVDASGQPHGQASLRRRNVKQDLDAVLGEAQSLLDKVLTDAGCDLAQVRCVGLGLPGIIDHDQGRVVWSPILIDGGQEVRACASDRFGVPVVVDNDANLVTLAELWFGKGRALADFAVITIEHGVGMGLVSGHRLYRGAHSLAMELGHTKVQLDGALCRCGQRGCLEAYVADYALVREASTALNWHRAETDPPGVMLESLYDQAKAGNEAARSIFRRAGRYLAVGLSNVVNLFDPSLILLSGDRLRYDYLYADAMLEEMRALTLNTTGTAPHVEIHAWGDLVWARSYICSAPSRT